MSHTDRDPWVDVKTFHGFPADHVISALQKEIRRGNTENAALLAYEMILTSPALEDYLWHRLKVISVEDIGFGDLMAPVIIQSLFQMTSACDRAVGERKLYAVHAVRYLVPVRERPLQRRDDQLDQPCQRTGQSAAGDPGICAGYAYRRRARAKAAAGAISLRKPQRQFLKCRNGIKLIWIGSLKCLMKAKSRIKVSLRIYS